jgi:hypothetical protein
MLNINWLFASYDFSSNVELASIDEIWPKAACARGR